MNCEEVKKLAAAAAYNESSTSELAELNVHMDGCPSCRDYFQVLLKTVNAIPRPALPKDDQFWSGQKSRIMEKVSAPSRTPVLTRWVWVPVAGLLAVLAVWAGRPRVVENVRIIGNMDFIQNMDVVENLDMLENMDVLDQI